MGPVSNHQTEQALLWMIGTLVLNPLYWVVAGVMIWEGFRLRKNERKFFGFRMTRVLQPVVQRLLVGFFVGLIVSVLSICGGVEIHFQEVVFISVIALVFGLIRVRLIGSIYAIVFTIILSRIVGWLPSSAIATIHLPASLVSMFQHLQVSSWVALAGLALLAEAILLRMSRDKRMPAAVVVGKRGKSIGAFVYPLSFVVPVVSIAPGTFSLPAPLPASWPWVSSHLWAWGLLGLPLVVGVGGVLITRYPTDSIRSWAKQAMWSGIFLIGCALLSHFYGDGYGLVGIVAAVVVREVLLMMTRKRDAKLEPVFSPTPEGVRILTTVQGSVAEKLGLLPGEVITHVNQVPVHTPYDLHFAFDQNPAYAKLQVKDVNGEIRIVGKAIYSGERMNLGLVAVPEPGEPFGYAARSYGLFQTLYMNFQRNRRLPEVHEDDEVRGAFVEKTSSVPMDTTDIPL